MDRGDYKAAEEDFRKALESRTVDQRWPRTYGLHFIPEYFPNRELGITLFYQDQIPLSITYLEKSIEYYFSSRAAYYLTEARRALLNQTGADRTDPTVTILEPQDALVVGNTEVYVRGIASDDGYVDRIRIQGEPYDIRVCTPEVSFEKVVRLAPHENTIHMEVVDLTGKQCIRDIPIFCDVDGPMVSFDEPVVVPGIIRGVAYDHSNIARLTINGTTAVLSPKTDGTTAFSVEIGHDNLKPPLAYECHDVFGNVTRGIVSLNMLLLHSHRPDVQFATFTKTIAALDVGLRTVSLGNGTFVIAAVPENDGAVKIEIGNILDDQQFFMDEIIVAITVSAPDPIEKLELNGQSIHLIPNRNSLKVSRKLRLQPGSNYLIARCTDAQGRKAETIKRVSREQNAIEMSRSRLAIAFLGNVRVSENADMDSTTDYILSALSGTREVANRFNVVDRSLLKDILLEQDLSAALASRKDKLALGKLIPAELMIAARIRRDQESIEIVLEGSSTETGVRVLSQVDVAGPVSDLDHLIETLGIRLCQELPRVQGRVLQWENLEITSDLNSLQGIRNDHKCIVFRTESVVYPDTGEIIGEKPVVLCEGIFNNVTPRFSTAKALQIEDCPKIETLNIETGDYVITK